MTILQQRVVPLLLLLLFLLDLVVATSRRSTVYISEFSYNQETGDFVEFVGPKNWQFVNTFLSFYTASSNNATGIFVDAAPLHPSLVEETSSSTSSQILETQSIYVYRSEDVPELSSNVAVGAIALSVVINGASTTLHYVSYGGTFNTSRGGLADGLVPVDVGVVESAHDGETDVTSVQLDVETETWTLRCSTPGKANRGLLNQTAAAAPLNLTVTPAKPWINEFHYTDASGSNANAFVEVAGPEQMPIEGYVLSVYQAPLGGAATLVQCIELQQERLETNVVNQIAFLRTSELLTIPHSADKVTAMALSANVDAGNLYDYISFNGIGGSGPSSTLNGPAAGALPTDVLVQESFPETAVGTSVQRSDVPLCINPKTTVSWSTGLTQSPNMVNVNQQANVVNCEELPLNPWRDTDAPTRPPTLRPTARPTEPPTAKPSLRPTNSPTFGPSAKPTLAPTTSRPTVFSSPPPTLRPSPSPTPAPSLKPSPLPSKEPTREPTAGPTHSPSDSPSATPSIAPSASPSTVPSTAPSSSPSRFPFSTPTRPPTFLPTASPTPCIDNADFVFLDLVSRNIENCAFIQERTPSRQETYCVLEAFAAVGPLVVRQNCPLACGLCPTAAAADGEPLPPLTLVSPVCPRASTDNLEFRITTKGKEKPCRFIAKKDMRIRKFCKKRRIRTNCPFSCRGCTEEEQT